MVAPALAVIIGIGGCAATQQLDGPRTPASAAPTRAETKTVTTPVPIMEQLPATVAGWNYTAVSPTQGFFDRSGDTGLVLATADFGSVETQAEVVTDDTFLADGAIICGTGFDGISCYITTPSHGNINLVCAQGGPPTMAELQVLATTLLTALS